MKPLHVFYVWSPKYEIFHHIFKSTFEESPHFVLHDIFVPQSVFDKSSYQTNSAHFLDGNAIKYRVLLSILEQHPDEHILLCDVDTIVQNPTKLREYLEKYSEYDIVYARSKEEDEKELSLGFGMFRSTNKTISFIDHLIQQIESSGQDDMTIFNKELHVFDGRLGMFTFPEIIQTQYYNKYKEEWFVIQITCSNRKTYEENLYEKLLSIIYLSDITDLVHLIPHEVLEALVLFVKDRSPTHYLATLCV